MNVCCATCFIHLVVCFCHSHLDAIRHQYIDIPAYLSVFLLLHIMPPTYAIIVTTVLAFTVKQLQLKAQLLPVYTPLFTSYLNMF